MSNHKPEVDPAAHVEAVIITASSSPPPPSVATVRLDELLAQLRAHAQRGYPEALVDLEVAAAVSQIYVRIALRWPADHAHHARHAVVILDLADRWEAVDSDGWRKQRFELRLLEDIVDEFRMTVSRLIQFGVLPPAIEREMVWYRASIASRAGFPDDQR